MITGALGVRKVDRSHFWRVLEYLNVACKTSTANIVGTEWFKKEAWGNMLTSDSVAIKDTK